MHRAPLYWTATAIALVFGAEAALAQGAINNSSAAINGVTNSASFNSGGGASVLGHFQAWHGFRSALCKCRPKPPSMGQAETGER
jgi:hypothetical protein